ncbi:MULTISPECIES: ion transporter [unclassified Adlercreutzia]|uniref:ion transporter n=1 Tax=unclassified Adlercreutzia TaxID=2636013 RepID=UPI0013ED1CD5|nr:MULTISPECIES: ion transporter [unclassified Adlercreutzia]
MTAKQWIYLALERPEEASAAGRALSFALVTLIVANALLVGTTGQVLSPLATGAVSIVSLCSTGVFAVEYLCRVWVADKDHPECTPVRARLRYIFSVMGIVDVLAFLPALFAFLAPESVALTDAVRVIRLVRLIKVTRYMRGLKSLSRVLVKHRQEIVASLMVLALLCIAASVLMYEAEHAVQPDQFDSVLTGLYWAMTTVTSTGYGDLVPITPAGRLIGFATMALSIAVVAIPAGIFSAGFVAEFRQEDRRKADAEDAERADAEAERVEAEAERHAAEAERHAAEAERAVEAERAEDARAGAAPAARPAEEDERAGAGVSARAEGEELP